VTSLLPICLGADARISADSVSGRRAKAIPHLPQLARVVQRRHQFILPYTTYSQLFAGQPVAVVVVVVVMMSSYVSLGSCRCCPVEASVHTLLIIS